MSLFCLAITLASLLGALWLRRSSAPVEIVATVGGTAPLLQVLDVETAEPMILVGQRGKVLWLTFWSVESPSARETLGALEEIWTKLGTRRKFSMVAAAVETNRSERLREIVAANKLTLPVYIAGPETVRRFKAGPADPPLHVLIDANGRIAAMARGAGRQTIDRIAARATAMLEELDPLGDTRFAAIHSRVFP